MEGGQCGEECVCRCVSVRECGEKAPSAVYSIYSYKHIILWMY